MSRRTKAVSRIAKLRERLGITQVQLAVLIGVTPNTVQNWESGKSGVDQIEKFLKLCEVLGCNLPDLIEYVPDLKAEESKSKGFSLDELRELRKRWTTDTDSETTSLIDK